jgi:hypothetical protein
MDTLGSVITIVLVLAAIFVPQALVIHFRGRRIAEHEEYIPDGR